MKTTREKKNWKTVNSVCAGFLALICAANVAVLSSCSYVRATDDSVGGVVSEEPYLCDPIETAFVNYFCVPDYDDITEEQFAQIETVDVYLVMPKDGDPNAVYVAVNDGTVEMLTPCILTLDVYENTFLPKIDELAESADEKATSGMKFRAFYNVKDPNDPELEPRAVAEMQALFPITKTTAVAHYDPFSTAREDAVIYSYIYEAGLVNELAFSETALRAKLDAIAALDDAQITITAAEDLADFAVDDDIFNNRSQAYKEHMSAYMEKCRQEQTQSAELALEELEQQIDINGNGIIGE